MNGIKYLLDIDALISFLQGNPNSSYLAAFSPCQKSKISILEFLSFSQLEETDKKLFFKCIDTIKVVEVKQEDLLIN